jgi:hypothetical protein
MNIIFKTNKYKEVDFEKDPGVDVEVLENYKQEKVDAWFNSEIEKNLDGKEYTNIFIPLSIGQSYVDYLGLRFALHIRTDSGKNSGANVFIYGTETIEKLVHNDCFDVLKLSGVKLIDYSKSSISLAKEVVERVKYEKQEELEKVRLPLPNYLFDNHSIANVWGMYRLLEQAKIDYRSIDELKSRNDMNGLYLKLLMAKNSFDVTLKTKPEAEKVYKASLKLKGLTVLGKIDLDKLK